MNVDPSSTGPHRNRPVHLPVFENDRRSIIVFVTLCAQDRQPLLADPKMHEHLKTAWNQAHHWQVGRYVIMPDHLHLFCAPGVHPPEPLSLWISYWKRLVTRAYGCPFWQKNFWDTQLRQHESYSAKWEYVRNNPVRAGLVPTPDEWVFQGEMNVLRWHD